MATAPPRPCTYPKCGKVGCTEHQAAPWRTANGPETPRIRGRQLQRMRIKLFARQPWCVGHLCDARVAQGQHRRPSTIRDHVIPLAEGGLDDESNEQGLCQECSDAKTREESKRGVKRWPHV
jgi:5-methylcytosine-specific restriction protein A